VADAEEASAFGGVGVGTRDLLDGQNLIDGMEHCFRSQRTRGTKFL
jgi:hypothetical protein